jgi:phenylpropionate dioxygenase-like ring-hydroxylating dioxygenase large terminal subunit
MKIETQRKILHHFFELRSAHTTTLAPAPYRQRASVYTDPARLGEEEAALFRGRPVFVALSADLPGTGECLATEVAGVPLLLARGEDAEVRAFLNICRHRGGRVFSGRGRPGRAFKCPYHSWAYDLNGELLGQPLARDAFEGLDRCELGLVTVPAAERFGLIAVTLPPSPAIGNHPRADSPRESAGFPDLAGLGPEIADWELDRWHFFDQRGGVFDANWKLIHDTFLESYHVFSLHQDTLAPDVLSTPFAGEGFGPHSRGVVMRKEVTRLLERPQSEWELKPYASVVYVLFPSVVINFPMSGHAELWEIYPEPGDPHRTRVSVKFYIPRAVADEQERAFWDANVRFTSRVVFEEDFRQQQDIHRSLRCGLMPEVFYGRNEPVLIHHHEEVERALAGRLAEGIAGDAGSWEIART